MTKILATQADGEGCGHYRIKWPVEAVNAAGLADVEIAPQFMVKHHEVDGFPVVVDMDVPSDVEVIIIQRPLSALMFSSIEYMKTQGIKVIVEMDDDIVNLPYKHPLRKKLNPGWHPTEECRGALVKSCEIADLVTTTTPALAKVYAPHGRAAILPNCLTDWYLETAQMYRSIVQNELLVVGYSGAGDFHRGDLEVVGNGLKRAQEECGFGVMTLGGEDLLKRLKVWGHGEHWRDMNDLSPKGYIAYLANYDIALAPLQSCAFNEGKSDLKMLEHAAFGVMTIGSPTDQYSAFPYTRTANTPSDWQFQVSKAAQTPELRKDVAPLLRKYAESRTFTKKAKDWAEAWQSVL